MRPPRLAILVLFFFAAAFLFCRAVMPSPLSRHGSVLSPPLSRASRLAAFFSFNTPFTLFPPNAAISLTDDNSTSFPARPAAFGPLLPAKGLSGQLWIGSGFLEDGLQDGEGEGELGCSDVPGWEDGNTNTAPKIAAKPATRGKGPAAPAGKFGRPTKREPAASTDSVPSSKLNTVDDGTDDYLHQGLSSSPKSQHNAAGPSGASHADIQSLQEAAEIAGKVVLLSRGGCGFLEKVKWAQRRGAKALIVGDNRKGGPLIQMFARGDTSNVTIPSVFTARTTAHLLSSLTQPGSYIEDSINENGRPMLKVLQSDKAKKAKKTKQQGMAAAAPVAGKATAMSKPSVSQPTKKSVDDSSLSRPENPGWILRLFRWGKSSGAADEGSRPPSSGRLDWVLVEDWSDEKDKLLSDSLGKPPKPNKDGPTKTDKPSSPGDDFLIGVQDWRDPDLVAPDGKTKGSSAVDHGAGEPAGKNHASDPVLPGKGSGVPPVSGPKGGSITPGSGEYNPDAASPGHKESSPKQGPGEPGPANQGGIISKLFGDDDGVDSLQGENLQPSDAGVLGGEWTPLVDVKEPDDHEGLWVTITPSSSAGSFFDTLLVLVISPLVTLSVVYSMLLLRARIRRRRWRAPKSVVDRLPVRTYHTVPTPPSHSPRLPSPTSASAATPLLQPTPPRPRPRSRTTTGVPESGGFLSVNLRSPRTSSRPTQESGSRSVSSEWKKYMGRQIECVVCLEEYVDGISRVMSLPCGHEFHAECITPWLTTRRRTCPICKGDVVRSLARGFPSSPRYESYHDDSEDDYIEAPTSNISTRPRTSDIEHGALQAPQEEENRQQQSNGWFTILSSSFGSTSRSRNSDEDRTA